MQTKWIINKLPRPCKAYDQEIKTAHRWECKQVQLLQKTVRRCLKKLRLGPPYDPGISLLGTCLKKIKTLI